MSENKKITLPTIKDLIDNVDVYDKQDKFQYLMNQDPPPKWIKTHPYIKNHKYLPIDKVEYLLRSIFKNDWYIEIIGEGVAFNGVYVKARVHYRDLITGIWKFNDGIGACELQTKKGSSPAEMQNINNGAVSMAFPIAKTLAVKDACDHFGNVFGANLNRKDIIPYKKPESIKLDPEEERITNYLKEAQTQDDLDVIRPQITEQYLHLFKEAQKRVNKGKK